MLLNLTGDEWDSLVAFAAFRNSLALGVDRC
jgi:hypothetical protein